MMPLGFRLYFFKYSQLVSKLKKLFHFSLNLFKELFVFNLGASNVMLPSLVVAHKISHVNG